MRRCATPCLSVRPTRPDDEDDVLLDKAEVSVTSSTSPVSFQTEGGGQWEVWDRYIAIDGKKAFHIGNVCGTCSFFFERMDGANRNVSADDLIESLNAGISVLDPNTITKVQMIVPNGKYHVLLLQIVPTLVQPGSAEDYFSREQIDLWGVDSFWGLPHFTKTPYYRIASQPLPNRGALYEFLIPTFPPNWLAEERVSEYVSRLRAGATPTAVSLSVLDVKQPADWEGEPMITSHWCLAHYLLDGHHKVFAASQEQLPITLIAFLAVEHGISTAEEVEALIDHRDL